MAPPRRHMANVEGSKLTVPKRFPYTYEKNMKAYHQKHASIQFRKDLMQAQTRANYHNEFDRISGILNDTALKHDDKERLLNRKSELRNLFDETHTY